jgi:hypothetical protein
VLLAVAQWYLLSDHTGSGTWFFFAFDADSHNQSLLTQNHIFDYCKK